MENSLLDGNFAPIRVEQTITDLTVTGTIPAHLDGRYLRNGPNPVSEVDPAAYHLFTGDGMVHGVRIRDGKAEWYRNRWVRSPHVARQLKESFGPRSRRAGFDAIGANTNVIGHAGRTLALIEGGFAAQELTEELETAGPCDFDGTITGGYTAHPKRDPDTGELHAVSYHFGMGNQVRYDVIDAGGRARRSLDIEVGGSPMMHDFSLTERHVIFYDLPVTFDLNIALRGLPSRPMRTAARIVLSALIGRVRVPDPIMARIGTTMNSNGPLPYHWNPRYPARIGVLPREGGPQDVRWFEIEPCYLYHPLNAYDDGDSIVLDVVRYDTMFDDQGSDVGDAPTLDRWTVDLNANKVVQVRMDDRSQEFPRVDERLVGKRHRYGYSVNYDDDAPQALLKHDIQRGTTQVRTFGADSHVSEFVFEPNSPDAAEDDGVLMGFVHDGETDRSDLVLLDAGTLDTVASIHLPTRVPQGFHGNWVPTT